MSLPYRFRKISFHRLAGLILLIAGCQPATAAIVTIEPDSYVSGTIVNSIHPGVLLRVYDSILANLEPAAVTPIEASDDIHPSTGVRVFSHNGIPSFSDTRRMDMTFTNLTDFVSIDFIGSSSLGPQTGKLEIYNAIGTLLNTYTTAALASNQKQTMSLTRGSADIKFARAYTGSGAVPLGRLDNLSFNNLANVPEPATLAMVVVAVMMCGARRRRIR